MNFRNRLENITLFHLLLIAYAMFICFAVIDISSKVIEHGKYDMDRLLTEIQSEFPRSEITFQNIHIVDNLRRQGRMDPYYDSVYYYIKDNNMHKEPSYLWLMFLIPPIFTLSFLHKLPRRLKIKEFSKISVKTRLAVVGSFVIFIVIIASVFDKFDDNRKTNGFEYKSTELINRVDLNSYLND